MMGNDHSKYPKAVYFFRALNLAARILIPVFITGTAVAQSKTDSPGMVPLRRALDQFVQQQIKVRSIYATVLSPDGKSIAWCADGKEGGSVIYRAPLLHPEQAVRISAAPDSVFCNETEPRWAPNGREIAFLSDYKNNGQTQVFVTPATPGTAPAQQLSGFDGFVSHLQWSPDGRYLSVLYVEKASREPSPMAPGNKAVGVIDSLINRDIQRIAVIDRAASEMRQVSPEKLYVFEYDWSPDSKKFAYTAAIPPGDDNWYIARLYRQQLFSADTALIYAPSLQIAVPRWSPDGQQVAYIEGLMSDQGGTGGEIFTISADGKERPRSLTPGRSSTPAWFTWRPDSSMLFSEFVGGSSAIATINIRAGTIRRIWYGDESIHASSEEMSLSVAGSGSATIIAAVHVSWSSLPEIFAGNADKQRQITYINAGIKLPVQKAENVEWMNDGRSIQGWLLYPANYNKANHYPMVVNVHGGPAWIAMPAWSAADFNTTFFTQRGYFVFFPNPRGSHGRGEAFTQANRRDWGHGDLKDIIAGIDTVIQRLPVDSNRLALIGWSYGGFMAMFSITQTQKFKAVVAGAGACDWLSYYGQNAIDKWMWSYFGASPYDDPEAYSRVSAMTYIKQARTPALVLVGELDGEAPAPQSIQFWHALKELKVPTQLIIYAGEGHSFYKLENTVDITLRTLEWIEKYTKPEKDAR